MKFQSFIRKTPRKCRKIEKLAETYCFDVGKLIKKSQSMRPTETASLSTKNSIASHPILFNLRFSVAQSCFNCFNECSFISSPLVTFCNKSAIDLISISAISPKSLKTQEHVFAEHGRLRAISNAHAPNLILLSFLTFSLYSHPRYLAPINRKPYEVWHRILILKKCLLGLQCL